MLIIAQPKTASTSLTQAMAQLTNKNGTRIDRLSHQFGKAKGFDMLPHTDLINLKAKRLTNWIDDQSTYYQQHIAPTKNNMTLLKKYGHCAITLRDPNEAFQAYFRQPDILKFFNSLKARQGEGAILLAKEQFFNIHNAYRRLAKLDNFMAVQYKDLITNTSECVNQILEFYGESIRVDKDYQLPKFRYTNKGQSKYKYSE